MKTFVVLALFAAGRMAAFGQSSIPELPRTVTEVFDRSISAAEHAVTSMAEAMPAEKYDFAPTNGEFKGVRTFAQMVKHIAVDQYLDAASLLGDKVPIEPGTNLNGPDSIHTKTEILQFLQDGFAYMHKAIRTVNQKNLMEQVNFQGGRIPRLSIVSAAISHPWNHYGQLVEYLRTSGIDPQLRKP